MERKDFHSNLRILRHRYIFFNLISIFIISSHIGCSQSPTVSAASPYSDLPAAANGIWTKERTPLFVVENSRLIIGGTAVPLKCDPHTGFIYKNVTGTMAIWAGVSWDGLTFIEAGDTLTKN
jgi:hypothetical protein